MNKKTSATMALWAVLACAAGAVAPVWALETTTTGSFDASQREAALGSKMEASKLGVNMVGLRLKMMGECSSRGLMYAPARAGGNGGCAPFPEPEQQCACSGGGGSARGGGGGRGDSSEKNASYQVRDAAGNVSSYHGNKQAADKAAKANGGSVSANGKGSSFGSGYKENSSQSVRSSTSKSGWSSGTSSSSKSTSSSSKSSSSSGGKSSSGKK